MPWKAVKVQGKWKVVRSDTGETVGTSSTEGKAKGMVRAMYANYKK